MKDIIYSFLKNLFIAPKNYLEQKRDIYNSDFGISHKTLCFSHMTSFQGFHVTLWSYIFKISASEDSESDCRNSFSSSSENIDVWRESGSELEEEIFEELSQNFLFAFEPVPCLGETDISRFPTNTNRSRDFHRLNELGW